MPATADVSEHPIIFSEWSVRRILDEAKTQTRRIVKNVRRDNTVKLDENTVRHVTDHVEACPYGQPGDVLWVREAFRLPRISKNVSPKEYVTGGDYDLCKYEADGKIHDPDDHWKRPDKWGRKRPSIHMPRELCRIRLRVEDVRVEPLQQISGNDARAEGCIPNTQSDGAARLAFAHKWDDIHGDGAWEENPWVWVVSFSRIE